MSDTGSSGTTRRNVLKTGAWSVPVVAVAAASPAVAASGSRAPTNVRAEGGPGEVTVWWEPPTLLPAGSSVIAYGLRIWPWGFCDVPGGAQMRSWTQQLPSGAWGIKLTVQVFAYLSDTVTTQRSSPVYTYAWAPDATPPDPPVHVTATALSERVDLSWQPPGDNGGAVLTGYDVYQATTPGGQGDEPVNPKPLTDTRYTVDSLTNGTTYYFTVTALNAEGESAPSDEVRATPDPTPPGVPTDLRAVSSDREVTLSWDAPKDDGGSSIVGYDVYQATAPGGQGTTPINPSPITGTNHTVAPLTNGTAYYFTVRAVNGVGIGAPSDEAGATTGTTWQNPPRHVRAVGGPGEITISWDPPIIANGATLDQYGYYIPEYSQLPRWCGNVTDVTVTMPPEGYGRKMTIYVIALYTNRRKSRRTGPVYAVATAP